MMNGTYEPMNIIMRDRESLQTSESNDEDLLERNRTEWVVVARVSDSYLFCFIVVVTLIVALSIGLMFKYR